MSETDNTQEKTERNEFSAEQREQLQTAMADMARAVAALPQVNACNEFLARLTLHRTTAGLRGDGVAVAVIDGIIAHEQRTLERISGDLTSRLRPEQPPVDRD